MTIPPQVSIAAFVVGCGVLFNTYWPASDDSIEVSVESKVRTHIKSMLGRARYACELRDKETDRDAWLMNEWQAEFYNMQAQSLAKIIGDSPRIEEYWPPKNKMPAEATTGEE